MWLGLVTDMLVTDMYVEIFNAMHVYLFYQLLDSKRSCQSITTFFDAAMYRCIAVLYIFSGFQGDGFLGIFFPILLCILYFSFAEWLAT